jgi:hypothetical protein
VTERCTGTATSTFGGGGGTKLFCSQALKLIDTNMTKAIRGAVAACCECVEFIFVFQQVCSVNGPSIQNPAWRHPIKIATIRLQWNPKAKMMRAVRIFTEKFYCGRSASFLRRQKDSFK